jgi:hypothetical protein
VTHRLSDRRLTAVLEALSFRLTTTILEGTGGCEPRDYEGALGWAETERRRRQSRKAAS